MKNFVLFSGTWKQKVVGWFIILITATVTYAAIDVAVSYNKVQAKDVSSLVLPSPGNTSTEQPITVDLSDSGKAANILVMGSDEREAGSDITGMRSDTTLIMHINKDRSKVTGVSIPRDSWVDVPSCKRSDSTMTSPHTGKFNYAFSAGGAKGDIASAAACTITTIQALTGVDIHGYIVVDMDGFTNIINSLGGVEMDIEEPIDSPKADLKLSAGKQTLNGKQALGYARARSGEGLDGSDLSRIDRQQELFTQVIEKAKRKVVNPITALELLRHGAEMTTLSPNLKPEKVVGLIWNLRRAEVTFEKLPVADRGDGANVIWTSKAHELFDSMK